MKKRKLNSNNPKYQKKDEKGSTDGDVLKHEINQGKSDALDNGKSACQHYTLKRCREYGTLQ